MAAGLITTVDAALAERRNGSATTLACPVLEQRAVRLAPGERSARVVEDRGEVLFVAAGDGVLRVNGHEHAVTRDTSAFLAAGDEVELENGGAEPLEVVVTLTSGPGTARPDRAVTARHEGRETGRAGSDRTFWLLVDERHGCREATQFLGVIQPGRTRMHNHPYDEVAFIVEGEGVMHWEDGASVAVSRGSCIYFPRLVFHSLENVAGDPLLIMGVIHPAGSPAQRTAVLDW